MFYCDVLFLMAVFLSDGSVLVLLAVFSVLFTVGWSEWYCCHQMD